MDEALSWARFAGAWLLVAGPLYQGSVELNELEFDREAIVGTAFAAQAAKARPSAWWWLLPPVMYVLHRRWYRALKQAMLAQLTPAQREQVTSFQSKATGWFTVAAGATLLATGETWQIVAHPAGPSGCSGCWSRCCWPRRSSPPRSGSSATHAPASRCPPQSSPSTTGLEVGVSCGVFLWCHAIMCCAW